MFFLFTRKEEKSNIGKNMNSIQFTSLYFKTKSIPPLYDFFYWFLLIFSLIISEGTEKTNIDIRRIIAI